MRCVCGGFGAEGARDADLCYVCVCVCVRTRDEVCVWEGGGGGGDADLLQPAGPDASWGQGRGGGGEEEGGEEEGRGGRHARCEFEKVPSENSSGPSFFCYLNRPTRFCFFPHEFRSLLCLKMQFGHRR